MKKLLLLGIIFLTGCTNPISSAIDKEGDKTRAEMQVEIAIARQEIANDVKGHIGSMTTDINQTIYDTINYLLATGRLR